MYHQVFVLPTERWIGPTMVVPYLGTVNRETHVASVVMCRSDQGRYLTENFFAKYCDEKGALVATAAEATVGSTAAFATEAFQTNELPTLPTADSTTSSTLQAVAKPDQTEAEASVGGDADENQPDTAAANKAKKEPVKK